jgi:putative ABC transport system ATP-binding protein
VLLADEPTGNLDSKNAQMVMDLLEALHGQGSTIVMVTHDPHSAERAQRQISLFDGKVVDDSRTRARRAIS